MRSIYAPIKYVISFLFVGGALFIRCATTTYVRPGMITEVDETFSDTDLKLMAEKMVQSMVQIPAIKYRETPPKIAILTIGNRTSQHIDTEGIVEKIMVALLKTGKVKFVDRKLLKEMAKERALVETQKIPYDTIKREIKITPYGIESYTLTIPGAVKLGKLVGADYFLTGDIMSIEKKKGTTYIAYYKLTLRLVDVNTSEIVWADEKEIKKIAKKGFFDW